MRTRLAAVLSLLLLVACTPQEVVDDPVLQRPEGVATDAPDTNATTPSADVDADASDDGGEGDTPVEDAGDAEAGPPDDGDLAADGWERRAEAPLALSEVAAAPFAGGIWTAGGFAADGSAVDAVLIYDPTFDAWEQGPSAPEALHHAALVAADDGLYLLGGYVGSTFAEPTAAVRVLDPATGEWGDGPPLPEARGAGAATWDGSRIVYGGGVGPNGLRGDVWALEDGAWVAIGELAEAREHLGAAGDGQGRVWFLGGRTGGFDTNLTTVDLVEGDGVRRLGDLPTARGGVAGFHLQGVGACSVGGEGSSGTFREVECIDAAGSVTVLAPLDDARHGLGAVVLEGAAYAVLGGEEPGLFVSPTLEALPLAG